MTLRHSFSSRTLCSFPVDPRIKLDSLPADDFAAQLPLDFLRSPRTSPKRRPEYAPTGSRPERVLLLGDQRIPRESTSTRSPGRWKRRYFVKKRLNIEAGMGLISSGVSSHSMPAGSTSDDHLVSGGPPAIDPPVRTIGCTQTVSEARPRHPSTARQRARSRTVECSSSRFTAIALRSRRWICAISEMAERESPPRR